MLLMLLKIVDKGDKDGDTYYDSRGHIDKDSVNQRKAIKREGQEEEGSNKIKN